jgi:hypothetical protein
MKEGGGATARVDRSIDRQQTNRKSKHKQSTVRPRGFVRRFVVLFSRTGGSRFVVASPKETARVLDDKGNNNMLDRSDERQRRDNKRAQP